MGDGGEVGGVGDGMDVVEVGEEERMCSSCNVGSVCVLHAVRRKVQMNSLFIGRGERCSMRTMPEQDPHALPPPFDIAQGKHPDPQELPAGGQPPLALPSPRRTVLLYFLAAIFSLCVALLLMVLLGGTSLLERIVGFPPQQEHLLPLVPEEGAETVAPPLAVLLAQVDAATTSGDLTEALKLAERALTLLHAVSPDGSVGEAVADVRIIRKIFDLALLLGEEAKAESMLGLLSFRGVGEHTLEVLRGLLLLRQGDREGARVLFERDPESPEHAYGLVLLSILEGRNDDAQVFLEGVRQSPDPLLQRAAATIQGAYDEFALFEEGKETHLLTLLGRALGEAQQCPTAMVLLEEVTREDPDYRDAWIVLGYCRLLLQDPLSARSAFERAYSLDPEKAETQYFLALSHERSGNGEEAERFFGYALQNGFQPALPLREKLAQLAVRRGMYAEAAEHYRAALQRTAEEGGGTPDDLSRRGKLYSALASLLLERLGNLPAAEEAALRARDELGDIPVVLDLLGAIALARGEVNQAATFLMAAVQQDPFFALAWYHKGLLAEEVKDTAEALRSYREAYALSLNADPALATRVAERHNALVMQRR